VLVTSRAPQVFHHQGGFPPHARTTQQRQRVNCNAAIREKFGGQPFAGRGYPCAARMRDHARNGALSVAIAAYAESVTAACAEMNRILPKSPAQRMKNAAALASMLSERVRRTNRNCGGMQRNSCVKVSRVCRASASDSRSRRPPARRSRAANRASDSPRQRRWRPRPPHAPS
jgi:hypothetical protein